MRSQHDAKRKPSPWAGALEQFRAGLQHYLLRRLQHADNAEELAQEVYLRLLRVVDPTRVKSPQAYMYRVAINALQEFKAREDANPVAFDSERLEHLSEQLSDDSAGPELLLERQAENEELEHILIQLPPMQRKVLLMATSQDLPHSEIGRTLGISVRTVRNHLYRALAFCRQQAAQKER